MSCLAVNACPWFNRIVAPTGTGRWEIPFELWFAVDGKRFIYGSRIQALAIEFGRQRGGESLSYRETKDLTSSHTPHTTSTAPMSLAILSPPGRIFSTAT